MDADRKQFWASLPPAAADEIITWDNNVKFREDRLYGLVKQLVTQSLVIKGTGRLGVKGLQHMYLDPVIIHSVFDKFQNLGEKKQFRFLLIC